MTSPKFVVLNSTKPSLPLSRCAVLVRHCLVSLSILTLVSCSLFDEEHSKDRTVPTLADLPQFDQSALGKKPVVTPNALHTSISKY
ncbi:MAG: hypothetical protein U5L01_13115 [Rheinheimera sp.]|nr:hypothetical protein [Rheinheimera sp.]